MIDIESGDVLAMTDARLRDVADEINRCYQQVRISSLLAFLIGVLAGCVALLIGNPLTLAAIPFAYLVGLWLDSYLRTTVLFYDLEPAVTGTYQKFVAAFEAVGRCEKVWHVSAKGEVRDLATWKQNAGAGFLNKRSAISPQLRLPSVVKSNLDPPSIRVGRQELYFFPDMALVLDGNKAGAVTYDKLEIGVLQVHQLEGEGVPSDAQVIGHTWLHPNKKGGPDRRYANNKQIPVCQYEELLFASPSGLRELVMLSKLGVAAPFVTATKKLSQYGSAADAPAQPQPELIHEHTEHSSFASTFVVPALAASVAGALIACIVGLEWNYREKTERERVALPVSSGSGSWAPELKPAAKLTPVVTGSVKRDGAHHSPAGIDVVVGLSIQGGTTPVVIGRTNLPNGTELMVTLSRSESDYSAQDKVTVTNGQFRAGPFSQRGRPLNAGRYVADVSSSLASLQPPSVRVVIGQKGENLRGMATRVAFGERVVAVSQGLQISGAVSPTGDSRARAQSKQERQAWWKENCKNNCTLLQGAAAKQKVTFDWRRCYSGCLADQPKR